MNLNKKHCVPCEGGTQPLKVDEAEKYLNDVPDWSIKDGKSIEREFRFKDFKEAVKFVNRVAKIAESEGHHPDIYIFYNRVTLSLSTHAIGGLSENDFILAAKINSV